MNGPTAQPGLTAYPQQEVRLRESLVHAPIAAGTFRRPISRCDLSRCRGMCCYDGVYVPLEAATVLQSLARDEVGFFASLGMRLPDEVVVQGTWRDLVSGSKTAVVSRPYSATVVGYPAHFNDTACVFLTPEGRCSLQFLAVARGQHPWYYKPFTCWMHPLTVTYGHAGKEPRPETACIGLYDRTTDPYRLGDYAGYVSVTQCGRTDACGEPASRVLHEELGFLGRIIGRDLVAEIDRQAGG